MLLAEDVVRFDAGEWRPPSPQSAGPGVFAVTLLDGALAMRIQLNGDPTMRILVPGDFVVPWARPPDALLRTMISWVAITPGAIALLGPRFQRAAGTNPSLVGQLHLRMARQIRRQDDMLAIAHLPRAEDRIVQVLRLLCDDFGFVARDGVVLGLPLSHEALARLIGARRPTVTLATRKLLDDGLLARRQSGLWVLPGGVAAGDDELGPDDGAGVRFRWPTADDPTVSLLRAHRARRDSRHLQGESARVRADAAGTLETTEQTHAAVVQTGALRAHRGDSRAPREDGRGN